MFFSPQEVTFALIEESRKRQSCQTAEFKGKRPGVQGSASPAVQLLPAPPEVFLSSASDFLRGFFFLFK